MANIDRSGSKSRQGSGPAEKRYGDLMRMNQADIKVTMNQKSEEAPQHPENKRGPDYDNRPPQSWITGKNEDATTKPYFDHSPKRSQMKRS